MYSKEQLISDIRALGIKKGDTLLIHSSYKSLGDVSGGAKTVVDAFREVLTDEGTLVFPTLSYNSVTEENPHFSISDTPSCVGYLSEFFRKNTDGVIRSLHPTHSCAMVGKHAEYLAANHELDIVMVGENSPIKKLPLLDGKILFLGCSPSHNTSMHGVEVIVEPPYLFHNAKVGDYQLDDGVSIRNTKLKRFTFLTTGSQQRYERLLPHLGDSLTKGKILDADCYLMPARAVWETGEKIMRVDPFFFVDSPLDPKNAK